MRIVLRVNPDLRAIRRAQDGAPGIVAAKGKIQGFFPFGSPCSLRVRMTAWRDALLESNYSDEVSLLWICPGSSC